MVEGMDLLNLDDAPVDPVERLVWLSGVREKVASELRAEWQRTYFNARIQQRIEEAEALRLHSHRAIMAFTRAENEARGRMIRWGDGQQ